MRLFLERARAVDPTLVWKPEDAGQIIEICSRLDGLPLAVELAATKVRHLTLTEIRDRLDERLPLLVDGSRDHPSRLQTMRNAIAWSHDLLSPPAASASSGDSPSFTAASPSKASRLFRVSSTRKTRNACRFANVSLLLIDASLLLREFDPVTGSARYRMLETIREYAGERLAQSGEMRRDP